MITALKDFGWRHKYKIGIGASCAIGIGALWYLKSRNEAEKTEEEENQDKLDYSPSVGRRNSVIDRNSSSSSILLICIRQQFDTSIAHFLSTFRIKLSEYVDLSRSIRAVKELRNNSNSLEIDDSSKEILLWEEIKVNSFTMVFITTYMVSSLTILLQVQLHIIAAKFTQSNNSPVDLSLEFSNYLEKMLPIIINRMYTKIFREGLLQLINIVKSAISSTLTHWQVDQKLRVEFFELIDMTKRIRILTESDFNYLIHQIFIVEDSNYEQSERKDNEMEAVYQDADTIIAQTYDVIESPLFHTTLLESFDYSFEEMLMDLRRNVFLTNNGSNNAISNSQLPLRAPPALASLLPQLKAVSARLMEFGGVLPSSNTTTATATTMSTNGVNIREYGCLWRGVSSMIGVEELCLSVLNSILKV